jgi:hypothetical protein
MFNTDDCRISQMGSRYLTIGLLKLGHKPEMSGELYFGKLWANKKIPDRFGRSGMVDAVRCRT